MKQQHFNRRLRPQTIPQPFNNSDLVYFTVFKDIQYSMSLTQFNINELLVLLSSLKRETTSFNYNQFESKRNSIARKTVMLISGVRACTHIFFSTF